MAAAKTAWRSQAAPLHAGSKLSASVWTAYAPQTASTIPNRATIPDHATITNHVNHAMRAGRSWFCQFVVEEEHMLLRSIIAPLYVLAGAQNGTGCESDSWPLVKSRKAPNLIRRRRAYFGSP
jgi:hypothetical protein